MKKIGVVGGVGWPSTIEYYRLLCEASQRYHEDKEVSGPTPMPEITIESLDQNFTIVHRGSEALDSWKAWDEYFSAAIQNLKMCGAELILIASATPHTRLEEISRGVDIPLVSMYDSVGSYCKSVGIKSLLVLGTMPTMVSPAFKQSMESFGISAFYPKTERLKTDVVNVIERLYQNKTKGTAVEIEAIVRSCVSSTEIENTAVCLGCTELPLAFEGLNKKQSFDFGGISYINSSVVHALSAFEACIG